MSANNTGWSLKKLPTISVPTPSQSRRRGVSARRLFYHMAALRAPLEGSGRCFVLVHRAGQLERRKGADEVGMVATDVEIGGNQQILLVVPPEDVAAATADAACDFDCHLPHKTGGHRVFFRFRRRFSSRPRRPAGGSRSPA